MPETSPPATETPPLRQTPLHELHVELGGRLVDFAGWSLPIQYEGVIAEHQGCRTGAALFDVSHMGIVELVGPAAGEAFEALTPGGITTLGEGRQRYCVLTTDDGGVIDDCIVTNRGDRLMVVVNASRRSVDVAHFHRHLAGVEIVERSDLALLALQGPEAGAVMTALGVDVSSMVFLDFTPVEIEMGTDGRVPVGLSRSGYTGEDGFELCVPAEAAAAVARAILARPGVVPAGLGARDTLRLEAGLALYGQDLDETTSPVEADLVWTMPKRRREAGGFPGAARIQAELRDGPSRRRVGIRPTGRRPVRAGTPLRTADDQPAGVVTSGGFGPTVDGPVAMGYVPTAIAADPVPLIADVRGNDVQVEIAPLPFITPNYRRGA